MFPEIDSFYQVRQYFGFVQEISHEGGPVQGEPLVKAAAGVVIANPFAGEYVEDLSALTGPSASLGIALGARVVALLGGRPVEGYGKGGIAGVNGDQDHVVACITTVFGDAFREAVGGAQPGSRRRPRRRRQGHPSTSPWRTRTSCTFVLTTTP